MNDSFADATQHVFILSRFYLGGTIMTGMLMSFHPLTYVPTKCVMKTELNGQKTINDD